MYSSLIEVVESVVVEAVESVFAEVIDCCKLLCALESSSFVEAVESVTGQRCTIGNPI